MSLSISNEGQVVVRAPIWMAKWMVDRFVSEKTDWIEAHLRKINKNNLVSAKSYEHGESHLFLGQNYILDIIETDQVAHTSINIIEDKIQITIYSGIEKEAKQAMIKKSLLNWYLEKGIETVTERVNIYVKLIGVEYNRITLKKVSSIWGSCSAGNNLTFNRKLVLAPLEIIDYVVIHEVSHMIHRNHSSRFWALVARHDTDYKFHRLWLKNNHHLLTI